jgi:hypothetical protein
MGTRGTRLAALTGVAFIVFLVPAVLSTSGAPNSNATAAKVQTYILDHKGRYSLGALLSILAVVFGLFFFGYLRAYFRTLHGMDGLAAVFFGGAILFGVGGALAAGIDATTGDHPSALSAGALQFLNVLSEDLNVGAIAVGLGVLYLAAGTIIYKTRALPVALAWVSWLLGLLAATFILAFISLVATALWVLYVSILLARRNPSLNHADPSSPTAQATTIATN